MSKRGEQWLDFSKEVLEHIDKYTVPQYGDLPDDPAATFSVADFRREILKYGNRMGSGVRGPEEQERDFKKIAHYACMGLARFRADRKK